MARIKIDLPATFLFSTTVPVRITDINYGGHMGNDSVLSLLHETRMQFLSQWKFTEMNIAGVGMIMSDVAIEFKNEAFYGDTIIASVAVSNLSRVSFDLYYKLETETTGKRKLIAIAKTGMVCYDYGLKKIVALPAAAVEAFR